MDLIKTLHSRRPFILSLRLRQLVSTFKGGFLFLGNLTNMKTERNIVLVLVILIWFPLTKLKTVVSATTVTIEQVSCYSETLQLVVVLTVKNNIHI